MNKIITFVLLIVVVLSGFPVFAQNTTSNSNAADMQRLMRARYGAPAGGMSPMVTKEKIDKSMQMLFEIGLLYKMLAQPTMVATDSGVIVAYGNTLRKYDKDLNVVKEVELDVNVDAMQDLSTKLANKYSSKIMDLMGTQAVAPSAAPGVSAANAASSGKTVDQQKEDEIKNEIDQMK